MELCFFGTSAGAPTQVRNTSAVGIKLRTKRRWYLVDAGEATLHRIMASPWSLAKLNGIFITHLHGDHIFGLPGLLYKLSQDGRTDSLTLIGPKDLRSFIGVALPSLRYPLNFISVEGKEDVYRHDGIHVKATPLSHRLDSFGYRFEETDIKRDLLRDKLKAESIAPNPSWGLIANRLDHCLIDGRVIESNHYLTPPRKPRAIFIAGDNDSPELLENACKDASVLVHEATYLQQDMNDKRQQFGHSSAQQVAQFAQSVELPNLILTHFSPIYPEKGRFSIETIHQEAQAHFTGTLFNAFDLACFTLTSSNEILLKNTFN